MAKKSNERRVKLVLVLLICVILISSVFGFILSYSSDLGNNDDNLIDYKGVKFKYENGLWVGNINNQQFYLINHPTALENLNIEIVDLGQEKVYIGLPTENFTSVENSFISQRLSNSLGLDSLRTIQACNNDSPECPDIPIVDCQSNYKSLVFVKSYNNSISKNNSCIFVSGTFIFWNQFIDKLTLNLLGI